MPWRSSPVLNRHQAQQHLQPHQPHSGGIHPEPHHHAHPHRPRPPQHLPCRLDSNSHLPDGGAPQPPNTSVKPITTPSDSDPDSPSEPWKDRQCHSIQCLPRELAALSNEAKKFGRNVSNFTFNNANAVSSTNTTVLSSSTTTPVFARKFAKKLTDDEQELLKKKDGCSTSCHKPFVSAKHYIDKCWGSKTTQIAAVFEEVDELLDDTENDEETMKMVECECATGVSQIL
ncbi:hypothetical protein FPV67DRAFT_1678625 [Lyophyllum atratum]|nr:hypothetical protein FPV67DRAFT_1678625 [Lyophyllum atratum]